VEKEQLDQVTIRAQEEKVFTRTTPWRKEDSIRGRKERATTTAFSGPKEKKEGEKGITRPG